MNNRCFPAAGEAPDPLPCVGLATVTLGRGPGPGGLSPPSLPQLQGETGEQGPAALLAARPLRGRSPDGESSPRAPAPAPMFSFSSSIPGSASSLSVKSGPRSAPRLTRARGLLEYGNHAFSVHCMALGVLHTLNNNSLSARPGALGIPAGAQILLPYPCARDPQRGRHPLLTAPFMPDETVENSVDQALFLQGFLLKENILEV